MDTVQRYSEGGTAVTLGSFIVGDNEIRPDPNNWLFQHEYGHYLQSQKMGWAYLSRVALPSLGSHEPYNHSPVEQDANIRAFMYFNRHISGYNGWDFTTKNNNPIIGYDPRRLGGFNNAENQAALQNGLVSSSWYDWGLFPFFGPLIPGILHTVRDNSSY